MISFEEKINLLIGKEYDHVNFHCWDVVCMLIDKAPNVQGTAKNLTCSVCHFKEELDKHELKEVDEYEDEDIIILGRSGIYFHAGVYFNGGVVHATVESGVIYQDMATIKVFYQNIQGLRV